MNGKSSMFSMPPPFALSLSKGERRVFQQPTRYLTVSPLQHDTDELKTRTPKAWMRLFDDRLHQNEYQSGSGLQDSNL
jgi:hypothetical protein